MIEYETLSFFGRIIFGIKEFVPLTPLVFVVFVISIVIPMFYFEVIRDVEKIPYKKMLTVSTIISLLFSVWLFIQSEVPLDNTKITELNAEIEDIKVIEENEVSDELENKLIKQDLVITFKDLDETLVIDLLAPGVENPEKDNQELIKLVQLLKDNNGKLIYNDKRGIVVTKDGMVDTLKLTYIYRKEAINSLVANGLNEKGLKVNDNE